MNLEEENIEQEIKKEFQLERMILFSDAVFAIVITLMAIEIRLPEFEGKINEHEFMEMVRHQGRNFMAYTISFFFIGVLWTRHLKLFSVLNDYDTGLIIRNLLLLFFVGLFPFSASVISHVNGFFAPYYVYFGVVFSCILGQYLLMYYINIAKPGLRATPPTQQDLLMVTFTKYTTGFFALAFIIAAVLYHTIPNEEYKGFGMFSFVIYAFLMRKIRKRIFRKGKT